MSAHSMKMLGIVAVVATIASCDAGSFLEPGPDGGVGSPVASVLVTPDGATLPVDSTVQLAASVYDDAGHPLTDRPVTWFSSDPAVAAVDEGGLVSAVAPGQIEVSATVDGVSGAAIVTVGSGGSLTILPSDTLYGIGDTTTLVVEARAADGSVINDPNIQWISQDTSIATVDSMGTVTAQALGIATIVASAVCCSGDFEEVVSVSALEPAAAVRAVAGDGLVSLSATEPPGGKVPYSYQWYRSATGGFEPASNNALSGFTGLEETDAGVVNGETYYYRLVATDADGEPVVYDEVSATPSTVAARITPPEPGDSRLILDTRSGGAHDIQVASTVTEAESAIVGSANIRHIDVTNSIEWSTDIDGAGLRGFVVKWFDWNGVQGDQGRLILPYFATPRPTEFYAQFKNWKGRTASDPVAHGVLESFILQNEEAGATANAAEKIWRALGPDWSGGERASGAVFKGTTSGSPAPVQFSARNGEVLWNLEEDGSAVDFSNAEIENVEITWTFYYKVESGQSSSDAVVGMWMEIDGVIVGSTEQTGVFLDMQAVDRFQFPQVMRDPAQDQSEYFWDIVVWTPQ